MSRFIDSIAGRFINWMVSLIKRKTYQMAIVRRYTDANGSFVGELYLLGTFMGQLQFTMIGVSLDTMPFDCHEAVVDIDTKNDFLVQMPEQQVRVGALDPRDNDSVRAHVAKLAREGTIQLQIQNRFVEHVLQQGKGE